MTTKTRLAFLALLAAAFLTTVAVLRTAARAEPDDRTAVLKVVRSDQDGGMYYQNLALKNDQYRFFERGRTTQPKSTLADMDLKRDGMGRLASFSLVLRAEPERLLPAPPNSQAVALPGSRWAVYFDIDGDSTIDVMVKTGPNLQETKILYQDRWVRVNNRKTGLTLASDARGDDGTNYIFAGGVWKKSD